MDSTFIQRSDSTKYKMLKNNVIVFVCEHGAAKSVIAATYFNKMAEESNLELRAIARGTNPDAQLSANTIAGLHTDGLMAAEMVPRKLSPADLESAQRIITFCELPDEYRSKTAIEQWDRVPPVSEDYEKARDAIVERIYRLIKTI